jgi:hypothetical protein
MPSARRLALALALGLALAVSACSGGSAKEVLDTAQLEEKQNELEHAKKLYRDVVARWPGTPEAAQAEARLRELGATP